MMGDVAISDEIQVSDHGFMRGDIYKVNVKTGIVGNIMMLKVKINNNIGQPWLCTKIEISLVYKTWVFPCSSMM